MHDNFIIFDGWWEFEKKSNSSNYCEIIIFYKRFLFFFLPNIEIILRRNVSKSYTLRRIFTYAMVMTRIYLHNHHN